MIRFRLLRSYVRARSAWESDATLPLRNAMFWAKNPRLYLDVRRRIALLHAGRGYVDA